MIELFYILITAICAAGLFLIVGLLWMIQNSVREILDVTKKLLAEFGAVREDLDDDEYRHPHDDK